MRIFSDSKEGEGKLEVALENLRNIYPIDNINGLLTLSLWKEGEVVKVRIKPNYNFLDVKLPQEAKLVKQDNESVLFEYNGFKYYIFHQA